MKVRKSHAGNREGSFNIKGYISSLTFLNISELSMIKKVTWRNAILNYSAMILVELSPKQSIGTSMSIALPYFLKRIKQTACIVCTISAIYTHFITYKL